mmetsp:Transcript_45721/g.110786  ORF Transcript_45721/g.110786 Transcript_45721/m.110786 type:complete len:421 (+) Transcript_45721:47-1309(+)
MKMDPTNARASNIRKLQPKERQNKKKANDMVLVKEEDHDDIETGLSSGRLSDREPTEVSNDVTIKPKNEKQKSERSTSLDATVFSAESSEASGATDNHTYGGSTLSQDDKKSPLHTIIQSPTASETHHDDILSTEQAELHRISDIDAYEGSTLEDKVDTFIRSHPVVMINRTWCLFSVDAQNFLLQQIQVPVHSIEVDVHPKGKEILKYVKKKTKHYTTPAIFIRGEFLGGFKEINILYAEGKLQKYYLKDLSQVKDDQRDAIILSKATPYFWFPEKVDGNVVRITGAMTSFASGICAFLVHYLFWARYIGYALAIDFVLRLLGGAKFSLFGRIAMLTAVHLEPMPRMGRPKQFATCCGVMFSGLGSLAFLVPFPYHDVVGSVLMSILCVASGMEGFLDFCVGCVFFRLGVIFGIFRGTS